MMRKTALLLAIMLGIQMLAASLGLGRTAEAAPVPINTHWSDDFESYGAGSVPTGMDVQKVASTDLTVTKEVYAGEGSKSVKIVDNSTTGKVTLTKPIAPVKDVVLELDIMASNWLEIHLREGLLSGPRLVLKQSGILEYYRTETKKFTRLATAYNTNEWNRFRIEVDNTAHTYDVYLNGTLIGEDLLMDSAINQVDNLYMATNNSVTSYTSYLDNIRLFTHQLMGVPGQFSLVSPSNGADQVELTQSLNWTVSENVYSYRVVIADNPGLTAPEYVEEVGAGQTSYVVQGLSADTIYYWSVIANNGAGETSAAEIYSFHTRAARDMVSLLGEDFESYTVGAVPPGFQYSVPSGSSIVVTDTKSSAPGSKGLVIADGNASVATGFGRSFTSVRDVIFEMDVYVDNWLEIYLRDGAVSGPRFYFKNNGILEYYRTEDNKFTRVQASYVTNQWNRLRIETDTESHRYNVYLNNVHIGRDLPMDQPIDAIDTLYISTNNKIMNTVYLDNLHISGVPFAVEPVKFDLVSPAEGAIDVRLPAVFQWNPHQEANSYVLTISETRDFSNPLYQENIGNVTEKQVNNLNVITSYYWKVTALTNEGMIDCNSSFSFTTERKRVLLWADNFEAYDVAKAPPGYALTLPKGSTALVSDTQFIGGGKHSLEIADRNDSISSNVKKTFNAVADVILEMDVYTDNWLEIHLREGTTSGPRLYFKHSGILQYYQAESSRFTSLPATYTTNQWNRLRIETNTSSHTYKVFINHSQIGGDLPMSENIDAIDNLFISTNNRLTNYTTYLDNIQLHAHRKEGAPDNFSLLQPVNEEVEVEKSVALSWVPSRDAQRYRLIAATNRELANPIVDVVVGEDTSSITIHDLLYNAQYFWKVVAENATAETDSREVFSFRTKSTLYPLEISLLSITDGAGQSMNKLESSRFIRIEGKVLNQIDENVAGLIAVALYDAEDTLAELSFLEKSVTSRGTEHIQAGFSLPVDSQGYYVMLFVWGSIQEQNLISNQIRYPNFHTVD
jgi:hypothetical protein